MTYTDAFVIPVPKENLDDYLELAATAREVWMDHGALDYKECVAESIEFEMGVSFEDLVFLQKDETVIFAWILYESKEERNRINALAEQDPRLEKYDEMPFDSTRMTAGGFDVAVG